MIKYLAEKHLKFIAQSYQIVAGTVVWTDNDNYPLFEYVDLTKTQHLKQFNSFLEALEYMSNRSEINEWMDGELRFDELSSITRAKILDTAKEVLRNG